MTKKFQLHQFLVSREFGGGGEIALQLARQWRQLGAAAPHVWVPGEGRASEKVRDAALPLRKYDGAGIFSRMRVRAALANLLTGTRLRASGRGLIHIHSPFHYAALRHGFRVGGVKRVLHMHLDFGVESLQWTLREPPDLIVTCANFLIESVRQALPESHRERTPIVAVPNAVNLEKFRPAEKAAAKRRVGAPQDQTLLLMMANLSPHKGQETAIRAVRMLADRGQTVQLWLAGADRSPERPEEARLIRLIDSLNLSQHVRLLGFRQDCSDLLQAADVVLLPSTSEGLPLTLLEAQATGVPVVAAPTAGVPEIIDDGQTGFLVNAGDAAGYAQRIESLIQQPAVYDRVATAARSRCRLRHSWHTYHARMGELYASVLAN